MINKKFTDTKKNQERGYIPVCPDKRIAQVEIPCGVCVECMRQKANGWKTRLLEEVKTSKNGKFVTLTISNESYKELEKDIEIKRATADTNNLIATLAMRRFLERWRKKYKKSVKHWCITELGQTETERIHLHGIIFTDETEDIRKKWQYGYVFIGSWVNEVTVNYIIKYMMKMDEMHKWYKPKVLTSAGIGKEYLNGKGQGGNRWEGKNTKPVYTARNGQEMQLPAYYRNKLFTEEQREEMWLNYLDREEKWIRGVKVSVKNGDKRAYENLLKTEREYNEKLGYQNRDIHIKELYKKQIKNIERNYKIMMEQRIAKGSSGD